MTKNEDALKKIIAHAKEYGFVFQSSEIYDGLALCMTGCFGVELKIYSDNCGNPWFNITKILWGLFFNIRQYGKPATWIL